MDFCASDAPALQYHPLLCAVYRVQQNQLVLHSDNGSPMKGAAMLSTLQNLGVVPSFSRSFVSDDNPYSGSQYDNL